MLADNVLVCPSRTTVSQFTKGSFKPSWINVLSRSYRSKVVVPPRVHWPPNIDRYLWALKTLEVQLDIIIGTVSNSTLRLFVSETATSALSDFELLQHESNKILRTIPQQTMNLHPFQNSIISIKEFQLSAPRVAFNYATLSHPWPQRLCTIFEALTHVAKRAPPREWVISSASDRAIEPLLIVNIKNPNSIFVNRIHDIRGGMRSGTVQF